MLLPDNLTELVPRSNTAVFVDADGGTGNLLQQTIASAATSSRCYKCDYFIFYNCSGNTQLADHSRLARNVYLCPTTQSDAPQGADMAISLYIGALGLTQQRYQRYELVRRGDRGFDELKRGLSYRHGMILTIRSVESQSQMANVIRDIEIEARSVDGRIADKTDVCSTGNSHASNKPSSAILHQPKHQAARVVYTRVPNCQSAMFVGTTAQYACLWQTCGTFCVGIHGLLMHLRDSHVTKTKTPAHKADIRVMCRGCSQHLSQRDYIAHVAKQLCGPDAFCVSQPT